MLPFLISHWHTFQPRDRTCTWLRLNKVKWWTMNKLRQAKTMLFSFYSAHYGRGNLYKRYTTKQQSYNLPVSRTWCKQRSRGQRIAASSVYRSVKQYFEGRGISILLLSLISLNIDTEKNSRLDTDVIKCMKDIYPIKLAQ